MTPQELERAEIVAWLKGYRSGINRPPSSPVSAAITSIIAAIESGAHHKENSDVND